jgi:hypothetical protein
MTLLEDNGEDATKIRRRVSASETYKTPTSSSLSLMEVNSATRRGLDSLWRSSGFPFVAFGRGYGMYGTFVILTTHSIRQFCVHAKK